MEKDAFRDHSVFYLVSDAPSFSSLLFFSRGQMVLRSSRQKGAWIRGEIHWSLSKLFRAVHDVEHFIKEKCSVPQKMLSLLCTFMPKFRYVLKEMC